MFVLKIFSYHNLKFGFLNTLANIYWEPIMLLQRAAVTALPVLGLK